VTENVKYRHAAHCYLADEGYGTALAEALDLNLNKVKELSALSLADRLAATVTK
jgi:catalase